MDIHVLDKSLDKKTVTCVFHVPIPDANNSAGTNWRTVLQRHQDTTPIMPWNDGTENTAIENGEMLEVQESVRFSSIYLTDSQRLDEIKAAYMARKNQMLEDLQAKLDFHSFSTNVG